MVRLAACKLDAKAPNATTYCAMAKRFATDVGFQICNEALQIHGGNGFALEYPISRVLCDARILNIFEGAAEIQANVIARRLLEDGAN